MNNPDNEGKVCDAVVRFIEKRTGVIRTQVRLPEMDGVGPPVDLRLKLDAQELRDRAHANRVVRKSD